MYDYNTISTAINTLNGYDSLEKQLEDIVYANRTLGFPKVNIIDSNPIEETIEPKKVIFNNPATIVIWNDGSKTVSKCNKEDEYDKVKGFLVCYYKKHEQLSNSKFSKLYDKILESDIIEF